MVSGVNRRRHCGSRDHFDLGTFLDDGDVVMELPALRRLEQRENLDGESYFGALADADEVTDRGVAAFSGLGDMFILGRVDELEHEVLHPVRSEEHTSELQSL